MEVKTMSQRELQREKRRIEILEAALILFVEKGYDATKTSEIAKAVKMSDGLMFHYFPTKESLYLELVTLALKGIHVPENKTYEDPLSFFYNICNEFIEQTKTTRNSARMFVLMEEANNRNTAPPAVYKLASQVKIIDESVSIIEEGQKLGAIRQGNPRALSHTFWGAFQGVMQELAKNDKMPIPKTEWILDIIKKK